jgi:hypothetical protein
MLVWIQNQSEGKSSLAAATTEISNEIIDKKPTVGIMTCPLSNIETTP